MAQFTLETVLKVGPLYFSFTASPMPTIVPGGQYLFVEWLNELRPNANLKKLLESTHIKLFKKKMVNSNIVVTLSTLYTHLHNAVYTMLLC